MASRRWKVGELARAAGVTVRTLHHYESMGLLRPSTRTESGHRLYSAEDVRRLYRILALRSLGLGLMDIAPCLDTEAGTLPQVVRRHLGEVEQQIEAQERLRSRLRFMLTALERDEEPSADRFLEAMEAMTMFERYYTPEQLAQIEERRKQIGDEGMKRAELDWGQLIQEVEAARRAGVDPASPQVQALAQRWKALIEQFTGGDEAIRKSLQQMYETEGVGKASHGMVSPELMEYIGKAVNSPD